MGWPEEWHKKECLKKHPNTFKLVIDSNYEADRTPSKTKKEKGIPRI